ncbi:stevor [Plasmodium falciparum HB3]|uniref:Stevor n=1 Tax=Plasmodium falciparum (isolate HB3) TaxID=137071 RepID=A0A0L7KIA5_PLAFX|nr:stevor [Plasmodium falciparum HB3]
MLLFTFLINTLVLLHNENYINNHYNLNLIQNNTKITTIKSRILAKTQIHNPHYHNDPELKEIIDKMNEEAIKKYQKNHDPYEQLKDVVEKNGRKYTGRHGEQPMSTIEKELLETYEEMFGNESDMLKSGMSPNVDEKSSTCECTNINNIKLGKTKGRDKYLKHLKGRCTRGICVCSVGSAFLTLMGLALAKNAAIASLVNYGEAFQNCVSSSSLFHIFDSVSLTAAMETGSKCASITSGITDAAGTAPTFAMGALYPWGIAALVLLILAFVLIILYIWLYKRRKNSLKHECKKHLCK